MFATTAALLIGATSAPSARDAAGPASQASARSYLVALSVADLDRSIAFYRRHFGFLPVERTNFPDLQTEVAFMERDGFRLELVKLTGAEPRHPPDPKNDASMLGFVKWGFAVADIERSFNELRAAGAVIVVEPFDDRNRGFRGGIVGDPDGNAIGLYQLKR